MFDFYYMPGILTLVLIFSIKEFLKDAKKLFLLSSSAVFLIFLAYIGFKYAGKHLVIPQRTLLFFIMFFVPAVAAGTPVFISKSSRLKRIAPPILAFFTMLVIVLAFARFLKLPEVPLPEARETGVYLKSMAERGKIPEGTNVLLEKSGWDWCVIYVESGLSKRIYFDRKSMLGKKMSEMPSMLLSTSKEELKKITDEEKISCFVFKNPLIKEFLRTDPDLKEETEIGGYSIFVVR